MANRKIDWSLHGEEIVSLYVSGMSARDLIQVIAEKRGVEYHNGTVTNYLGRRGVLRSKSEAHTLAVARQRRLCELCNKEHTPRNYNQRWCDECTGGNKYTKRIRIHGLPASLYESLFESQGHRCKICGREFETCLNTKHRKTLFVDHDHCTQQVRGLLCPRCNTGLSFIDDEVWHEQAMKYVEEARKNQNPVFVKTPRMRKYSRNKASDI